ncbi:uncharacterized protein [Ptychodera flava]|uniref:uncharacterized protein n=1 Tax=Ptychodera flava TaxID=63121 RepID=UPI003969D371
MQSPEEVLCISTIWDKTTRRVISNFCKATLHTTPNSKIPTVYCTFLDVEVSEETKNEAARYGVTLITASRNELIDPLEDPPGIHWLINHNNYYPGLRELKTIGYVVGLSTKTKNAACVIHRSLFPEAKLHHIPSKPAAGFVAHAWDKDELGLTGFHRSLVEDFCERKAKAGEVLKAYSTVVDVKISDDQKKDAQSCSFEWLVNHESYYPYLGKIENVQYVIGYAPKTGLAAAYIREKLFPGAKLVLINHACPESNCLQVEEPGFVEFEEKMLLMASKADLVFSIGPQIHQYFQNAYRTEVNSKILSEIPHEEILPRPISCTLWEEPTEKEIGEHHIVTCGQIDTKKAIERCDTMAASIGTAANLLKASHGALNPPRWKIQGVSDQAGNKIVQYLSHKMQCPHIKPILYPGHSAKYLVRSLQQSHLCLPVPSYVDYSYYGMEAMVSGLPTAVDEDSHLAHFIKKHFMEHATNCIVSAQTAENNLTSRILKHIQNAPVAFKQAKALKKDLEESAVIATACARFTTLLTCTVKRGTRDANKDYGLQSAIEDILEVQIVLDDSVLQQHLREETTQAQISQDHAEKTIDKLKAALKRKVDEVVADEDSCKEVKEICKKILDDVDLKGLVAKSLGILIRFLALYTLYKLKHTCRSGSLAKAFEPLLITDDMRKMAAAAEIKLQLKATYDTKKFKEVELFFINRDGGGVQPVKFSNAFAKEDNDGDTFFDYYDSGFTKDSKVQFKSNDTETSQTDIDLKDTRERDVGGIQPVKFYGDVVEEQDVGCIDRDGSVVSEDTKVIEIGATDFDHKDHGQNFECPREIRRPSPFFTGVKHQEALQNITIHWNEHCSRYQDNRKRPVLIEIFDGLGGCGKTEIINQYIWQNWKKYNGHLFIMNGRSHTYLDFGLKELLKKTGSFGEDDELPPKYIRRDAIAWLRQNDKWLLVIDDVEDPGVISYLFPEALPLLNGHILITTRSARGWEGWYNGERIHTQIDSLSYDDAAIYFVRMLASTPGCIPTSIDGARDAIKIMEKDNKTKHEALLWLVSDQALHGLPIALRQACMYMVNYGVTMKEYKQLFQDCNTKVLRGIVSDPIAGWLKANGMDSIFAPTLCQAVIGDLLQLKSLPDKVLSDRPICMTKQQINRFRAACDKTEDKAFARMPDPYKGDVFTTWKLNYERLCNSNDTAAEFLRLCCCLSTNINTAVLVDGANHIQPGKLKDHLLKRDSRSKYADPSSIYSRIMELFDELRKHSFASPLTRQESNGIFTNKHDFTRLGSFAVHHLVQLVIFKLATEQQKARSINTVLAMLERLFPKFEDVYADQIEVLYAESVRKSNSVIASHALALARQIGCSSVVNGIDNTHALFSPVATYLRRMGFADDAKVLYNVMARLSNWRDPKLETELAREMYNLGNVNYELGLIKVAEENLQLSIKLYRKLSGPDTFELASAMQSLGRVQQNNHEYMCDETKRKEIEELLRETLNKKETIMAKDEDNETIANAKQQLGRFYQDVGDYKRAQTYLQDSVDMRKRYWQRKYDINESVAIAVGMTNLARNYLICDCEDRQPDKAEGLLIKAYNMKKDRMPHDIDSYQLAVYYLAVLYHDRGENDKSLEYRNEITSTNLNDMFEKVANDSMDLAEKYPPEKTIWL